MILSWSMLLNIIVNPMVLGEVYKTVIEYYKLLLNIVLKSKDGS